MKWLLLGGLLLLMASGGPPKEQVMASCQGAKASRLWNAAEAFQICMSAKDFHLESRKECRGVLVEPNNYALHEPRCWF